MRDDVIPPFRRIILFTAITKEPYCTLDEELKHYIPKNWGGGIPNT